MKSVYRGYVGLPSLIIAFLVLTIVSIWMYVEYNKAPEVSNEGVVENNGEALPKIDSISPSTGPIGTIVTLNGKNLAGFEGDLDAWIENEKGEKAYLPSYSSVYPRTNQITVKIDGKLCKQNNLYSGNPCTDYLTIIPGNYKIYTEPFGKMSNKVDFVVTFDTSSWKTYRNKEYGFEFKYPFELMINRDEFLNNEKEHQGSILIDGSPMHLSLEEKEVRNTDTAGKDSETKIVNSNGVEILKNYFEGTAHISAYYELYFIAGNAGILITFIPDIDNKIEAIQDSIKFTNEQNSGSVR